MSLIPRVYRDWWDDLQAPSSIFDQHFGLGISHDDLLSSWPRRHLASSYLRPWLAPVRQTSGASSVVVDNSKFEVNLDVQQFSPNEITVKTIDNKTVVVEGKHEEKQDEHGYISRHFVRRYLLPPDVKATDVISCLSSDGVLKITAPKLQQLPAGERIVPIRQTGLPAVKPVDVPQPSTPTSTQTPVTIEHPVEIKQ